MKSKNKLLIILAIFFIGMIISIFINTPKVYIEEKIEAFKNGEVLVCHKTLIVSNEDWKLNQDHLINNNSAGYVHIAHCEKQK